MKIGIIVNFKNTFTNKTTGVWGEELIARALMEGMRENAQDVELYTYNECMLYKPCMDCAIHLSNVVNKGMLKNICDFNVLWIQGFNYDGNLGIYPLDIVYKTYKDLYNIVVTASRKLSNMVNIPFVIPGVDTNFYKPVAYDKEYDCDIAYIGNIIKNSIVSHKYLNPTANFDYKLYGGDFGKIDHETALKVMCSAKINLNFHFQGSVEWDMVTARAFHTAACNAFQICDRIPFLEENFKFAICFTDGYEQEIESITAFLADSDKRKEWAQRAYEIVKEKFDCRVTAKGMLEALKKEEVVC